MRSAILGGTGVSRGQEDLILATAESLEAGHGLAPAVIGLTPKDEAPSPERLKAIDEAVLSRNDPLALAAVARGTLADNVSDSQVAGITAPVLAIIGSKDPIRPGVDLLKKLLPSTQVVIIPQANHMSALVHPDFIKVVSEFLAAARRRSDCVMLLLRRGEFVCGRQENEAPQPCGIGDEKYYVWLA